MAVLDFARGRAARPSQALGSANRAVSPNRRQSRLHVAAEVGGSLLVLILIAVGIFALQYVLVVARGVLG